MSDELTCRQLALKDMADASIVFPNAFDARLPWLAGGHSPEEDLDFWSGYLFANCVIRGVARQAELIGVIAFRENWIEQLYVLPHAQGQGTGSGLLDVAKARHSQLELWVFQKNDGARRFYESRGFCAARETDGADNEEREPDILYYWRRVG
ncbi:GNAT family N-acetyltransferase [Neorhizobium sp. NPDC001467]|uniref:GNAT family N-acetyltransferase n=1 Tax=Neorhizobium sp. NPDC001467 TaxID=3390595 RepID=UPI003D0289FC